MNNAMLFEMNFQKYNLQFRDVLRYSNCNIYALNKLSLEELLQSRVYFRKQLTLIL